MKTIELTDEQYELLQSLVQELQTQPNWLQAFPYFWVPSSLKKVPNVNDEGREVTIFDSDYCEQYTPREYAEEFEDRWEAFLEDTGEWDEDSDEEPRAYTDDDEEDWVDYIRDYCTGARVYTYDWERQTENNPSLFLSDVQNFCDTNQHHLGREPKPYSSTIWRMPKMEQFIKLVMSMVPPQENTENEIMLYVYNNKKEA